jgi:hypothetical protein
MPADLDGDGVTVCDGDCDDLDLLVRPGASEVRNGLDDDCDGEVDEGLGGCRASLARARSSRGAVTGLVLLAGAALLRRRTRR